MPQLFDGEAGATELARTLCKAYDPACEDQRQALEGTRAALMDREALPPNLWRMAVLNRALGRAFGEVAHGWPRAVSESWVRGLLRQAKPSETIEQRRQAKQVLRGVMETTAVCLGCSGALLVMFSDEPSRETRALRAMLLEGPVTGLTV